MTVYILAAFLGGVGAMALRLPPLVGFLGAGFVLNALGYELTATVDTVAALGVTLLLFTIGLKLRVQSLIRPEVWGAATLHIVVSTVLLTGAIAVFKVIGFSLLAGADLQTMALLGFGLSFSSTVFAVKVLEGRSEMGSLYGRVAIGVLIMQDLLAVLFLTFSTGKLPSPWAVLLLLLIPLAPVLRLVLDRIGHGEMQVLFGILVALVLGYSLFDVVGVKGDLGALIVGMLLAPAAAASDLSRALFNLKELFLVGFFVSIGLTAPPTWQLLALAVCLLLVLPVKSTLYLLIFTRFRLRGRSSLLSTLSLTNYSEFGLIVTALATERGWLAPEWLVVLALAVSLSFVLAAPMNTVSEQLYRRLAPSLVRLETEKPHPSDRPIEVGDAEVVIMGMGRTGRGAYDEMVGQHGMRVLGIDNHAQRVADLQKQGYRVVEGDAVNSDFWEKLSVSRDVKLILLAMPHHAGNVYAIEQLNRRQFTGKVAAIGFYEDEAAVLRERGVDAVFNIYGQAGKSLAEDALRQIEPSP